MDPAAVGYLERPVHSSTFKDFLPKVQRKTNEELYFAYCVLVKQDLLTSLSDAMPKEARCSNDSSGTSTPPQVDQLQTQAQGRGLPSGKDTRAYRAF